MNLAKSLLLSTAVGMFTLQANAAELRVGIEIPSMSVAEYHNPYVAVWLENKDNREVTNLEVWYDSGMENHKGNKWLKDQPPRKSGALVGAHYSCDPKWGVGCALGWAHNLISEGNESDVNNGINATLPVVAPYGYYNGTRDKRKWSAFQSIIISNGAMKTRRYISAPALNGSVLKGKIPTNIVISNTYIGCSIEQANQWFYTPYGALAIVWDKFGAFNEHAPTDLDQEHSALAAELLLSPGAHNTTYAAPELGVRIAKQSSELTLGTAEYFLSLAGTYLYSPSNSYGMNYVNNPSPYTVTTGSASALYGSVALGAQITTYAQWSWGLMGRVDFSRLDTIYRAMLFVKKKFK